MIYLEKERRNNEALLHYWEKLCAGRPFPCEDDLELDQLLPLWDECFLLQSRDVKMKKDYNFTYLGRSVLMAYQAGQIPYFIKGVVSPEATHLAEQFEQVIAHPAPLVTEGEHPITGRGIFRFRQILLPLSHQSGQVDVILGRLAFRMYREDEEA